MNRTIELRRVVVTGMGVVHMDRFTQYAVVAPGQAMQASGLDLEKANRDRIGVIVSSGIGGMETFEAQTRVLVERGPRRISPFFIPMLISDIAPGHITADVMVAGGAEAAITPLGIAGFNAMKALSTRNDAPQKASRPFDMERDGFVLGEGAGIVVLESLEHALDRDAAIIAEVAGIGYTADAYHITAPAPGGDGARAAMTLALQDSELGAGAIDYVNTHGTSTPHGDIAETTAIKSVFGARAYELQINSTKSMIGHLLGASGGVEFIVTALSVQHDQVHPTINLDHPDPECDLDYTANKSKQRRVRAAICNSFGFGGHNVAIVVKKYP
jgi:3-oxoacyl-[acyl-carrier-protein] synthase II